MGSAQSAVVRMRTVASSTFLLLLLLHTSQALWCYTCNSIGGSDSDCENGSTNMKSEDCGSGLYYDCSVTKTWDKSTGEIWSRGCCDDRTSGCRGHIEKITIESVVSLPTATRWIPPLAAPSPPACLCSWSPPSASCWLAKSKNYNKNKKKYCFAFKSIPILG